MRNNKEDIGIKKGDLEYGEEDKYRDLYEQDKNNLEEAEEEKDLYEEDEYYAEEEQEEEDEGEEVSTGKQKS